MLLHRSTVHSFSLLHSIAFCRYSMVLLFINERASGLCPDFGNYELNCYYIHTSFCEVFRLLDVLVTQLLKTYHATVWLKQWDFIGLWFMKLGDVQNQTDSKAMLSLRKLWGFQFRCFFCHMISIKPNLSIYYFMEHTFGGVSKTCLPNAGSLRLSLVFPFRRFVLCFTFRSMIHFC